MTNAELISMVRSIAKHGADWRINEVLNRAADALEAADEKIADCVAAIDALDDSNDAYIKANERLKKQIAELEAQLPKEGEWIYTPLERYKEYKVKCPFCGAEYRDCYDGYIDAEDMNYCPNCGAKMKGEKQ